MHLLLMLPFASTFRYFDWEELFVYGWISGLIRGLFIVRVSEWQNDTFKNAFTTRKVD